MHKGVVKAVKPGCVTAGRKEGTVAESSFALSLLLGTSHLKFVGCDSPNTPRDTSSNKNKKTLPEKTQKKNTPRDTSSYGIASRRCLSQPDAKHAPLLFSPAKQV
jgi:hypothetical protein